MSDPHQFVTARPCAAVGIVRDNEDHLAATVAYLHDVLEDTAVTENELRAAGFDDNVYLCERDLARTETQQIQKKLTCPRCQQPFKHHSGCGCGR